MVTTTRYMFLYRSPTVAPRKAPSPAEMERVMAEFRAWKAKFRDEIVDMGDALTPAGAVCRSDGVTDGPYIEGKEVIGGYMIVATSSLERAIQLSVHDVLQMIVRSARSLVAPAKDSDA